MKTLITVRGEPVTQESDGRCFFRAGMTINGDGSPRCYAPNNSGLRGLDYLDNAGGPGNWWGIAVDQRGIPFIQGAKDPYPGYYVSTTSLKNPGFHHGDPRREVDSEKVPFIVVPRQIVRMVVPVVMGCKAQIRDMMSGKVVDCVVADVGPATHLGEASIAAADLMGVNSDARKGGTNSVRFEYSFWPGVAVEGFRLQPAGK